jgi:hypothetical protein
MARDDYGAINVISDEEKTALGLSGPKPEEDEGVFEQIGKTADKIGETKLGKKIGSILTVLILAMFGSGTADLDMFEDIFGSEEPTGPLGGCMDPSAVNYNRDSTFDNGSCVFPPPVVYGCTNPDAENYNAGATHDNGRCQFLGGPGDNQTGNQTSTNETVYGCMDIEATNYNDRADEDDGSCEYEEYECTANQTYFWNGMQYGNYSRANESTLNITVDVDTNCNQVTLPIMIGYDVGHLKVEDNETVWNGYMYNDYFYNITGWEEDKLVLHSGPEYFTEPYTGYYIMYVNLWADWHKNGTYEWVDYFIIEELLLEE